jgi:hypothetical protein
MGGCRGCRGAGDPAARRHRGGTPRAVARSGWVSRRAEPRSSGGARRRSSARRR